MIYRARLFQAFFKITAYIPQKIVFKIKLCFENRKIQSSFFRGSAIIVSNHLSVYDYIALIFAFFFRTTRGIAAEVLFKKNIFLTVFLHLLGLLRVNRGEHDFGFEKKAFEILKRKGIVVFHPEGRVPDREGDKAPLPFKTTFVYMALRAKVPVIPVYTNGKVFSKEPCRIVIGCPIDVNALYNNDLSEKENRRFIADYVSDKIQELSGLIPEKKELKA